MPKKPGELLRKKPNVGGNKKPRRVISEHLKAIENKKPGWRNSKELADLINDSFLEGVPTFTPVFHNPKEDAPYVIAYFKGERIKKPSRRGLLVDKHNDPTMFFRYVKNPENLGLKKAISELAVRVRMAPYKKIRFHLDGFNPETGERVYKAVWIKRPDKTPPRPSRFRRINFFKRFRKQ